MSPVTAMDASDMKSFIAFFALAAAVFAQDRPAPIISPEVQSDGHVIFRLRAPQAHEVTVSGEWGPNGAMTKDAAGVWSVTIGPVKPDLYGYGFVVDGVRILDPANTAIKPMRSNSTSILDVAGTKPSPCDRQNNVPHGTVHLHAPYQPYQLLKIPYANAPFIATAAEAVNEARKARGAQVDSLLAELKPVLAAGQPVFLTGDFNEPSHQDWTPRAAAARKCPLAVEYPATLAIVSAGMRDSFRSLFPDEVSHPGET